MSADAWARAVLNDRAIWRLADFLFITNIILILIFSFDSAASRVVVSIARKLISDAWSFPNSCGVENGFSEIIWRKFEDSKILNNYCAT